MDRIIFVVDDNDVNLVAAENALADDFNVLTMPSAEGMFELLKDVRPDLILLDIEMPGMDGFEAMQTLKSKSGTADIPVIFVTGKNDKESEAKGFEMGAVDFITKPFSEPVLIERINLRLNT